MKTVDRVLNEGEMVNWVIDCIRGSIQEYPGMPLKTRENKEFCQYIKDICRLSYKLHLFYWLRT